MQSIRLCKPIILRSSLNDMNLTQRENAIDLLTNQKFLVPGQNGLRFVPLKKESTELPKYYLYGSEAVCYYRQSLGLPDVSITVIHIDDIIMETDDFDHLYDILFFLNSVRMRNDRFRLLMQVGVPAVIKWNEYRMLQEYVESLQDNHWSDNPVVNRFNVADPEEEPEWEEIERKSLVDIGYSLVHGKCEKGDDAEE